jgi:hypothetical protein
VVAGIIAGAVHGAWAWMGVPVFFGVLMAAEIYAAVRRERRDMELEELVGPLPATDEIRTELLDEERRNEIRLMDEHVSFWERNAEGFGR